MEIREVLAYYINESKGLINVTFKTVNDDDDEIRLDQIEMSEFDIFGFSLKNKEDDLIMDDDDDIEDFLFSDDDDIYDEDVDYDELLSFLNEYYLIYPERIPEPRLI